MDVLSVGHLLGLLLKNSSPPTGAPASLSKSQLLNVSMHLLFIKAQFSPSISYKNLSDLYLEGVYDPLVSQMYLIGCRKVIIESVSLERGLDCLIEVNI